MPPSARKWGTLTHDPCLPVASWAATDVWLWCVPSACRADGSGDGNCAVDAAGACIAAAVASAADNVTDLAADMVTFGDPSLGLSIAPVGYVNADVIHAIVEVLAAIHPFFAVLILISYVVSFVPLVLKKRWKERKQSQRIEKKAPSDTFGMTSTQGLCWR